MPPQEPGQATDPRLAQPGIRRLPREVRAIGAGRVYHRGHKGKEVVQLSSDLPERTVTLEVAGR